MPNRSERLVSEKAFALTHRPDVVTGSSGDCRKFFSAQAAAYSRTGTTLHAFPFQCMVSGAPPALPTAQMSLADIAVIPES